MIITTIEELRLFIPSHAVDHVEALAGFINNSEHDFLRQPLGRPLYDWLCGQYRQMVDNNEILTYVQSVQQGTLDQQYGLLLLQLAQRCVAFDALAAAIDVQAISLNNAGVNYAVSEDYPKPDREGINAAKSAYNKEAHKALNQLLESLEQWTQDAGTGPDGSAIGEDLQQIVTLWRSSRYFYLAAQLLIPSAVVLQEYLNIYDSREKFILMLPDLHFIQEEQIAPVIGEDFCNLLVSLQLTGGTQRDNTAATDAYPQSTDNDDAIPLMLRRILHKLRKVMATFLEGRTVVIRIDKERRIAARDEGVRLLGGLREYCQQHQPDILRELDRLEGLEPRAVALLSPIEIEELDITDEQLQQYQAAEQPFTSSPYFVAPFFPAALSPTTSVPGGSADRKPCSGAILVTPPLL